MPAANERMWAIEPKSNLRIHCRRGSPTTRTMITMLAIVETARLARNNPNRPADAEAHGERQREQLDHAGETVLDHDPLALA